MFKALLIDKNDDGLQVGLNEIEESQLPEGDVRVKVLYSTLNYKDGLAITGKAPVVRKFPMVPGIDFAAEVVESNHQAWSVGDKVILNGWGVGESHWGGLAEQARVNGDWLVALPESVSAKQAMSIGTAGYTAMLCVMGLQDQGVKPEDGEIIVTGANGGVGSIATLLLSKLGYTVVASTGRLEETDYLKSLGATEVIHRDEFSSPGKPLARERWAGAVDSVGSHTLANVCASTRYGGVVTACGLAQGMDFPATVAPFILRGVRLIGIDSVNAPLEKRIEAWTQLANLLDMDKLAENTREITLNDCVEVATDLLAGKVRGRVVVDCTA
ncbi:MDR family oxidoreductase [Leucothrix pacifica]|uniref:Alcohol dehydrogenase n=1 Tax=Leucothrix pacifica TaxID=1247513 RepID=A0A317CL95_9GAMM|nr:MDR family oxidoreductase [Leucothrix pacifica]PWQ99276.1 alcohol dehydrogenase [Leucothrix pacifica]